MSSADPPTFRDLKVGDRLVLIHPDNSRRVAEVTSVGEGRASGRYVGANGPEGRAQKIYSRMILCRDGQPEAKCINNLVAGDLVYTPSHRSGLQYGKIVAGKNKLLVLRWDEKKQQWLKRPQDIPWDAQWFAHESESDAMNRFHSRINEDRDAWNESDGRSGDHRIEGTSVHVWRAKERRWDLNTSNPQYFRPLTRREVEDAKALEATLQQSKECEQFQLDKEPSVEQPEKLVYTSPINFTERLATRRRSIWSRLLNRFARWVL